MNTSEAEIQPALSPLYEISKRLQGQLLSLRSLELAGPQLRIRRLVLGPFRSALNPIGVMSADFVARAVVRQARWGWGLVIVSPNPLTYLLMPLAALSRWARSALSSWPLLVRASSRRPVRRCGCTAAIRASSSGFSSGSPPVSRRLVAPSATAACTTASRCGSVSSPAGSWPSGRQ